jgi:capsular exopolysaccharide synthesis family protein
MHRTGSTTLRDYVAVVRRQRWIVAAVTLIFAGVAFALTTRQETTYRATARLLVHDLSQSYALTGTTNVPSVGLAQLTAQEAEAATAPVIAQRAAQRLGERDVAALAHSVSTNIDIATSSILLTTDGATGRQAADRANAFAYQAVSRSNQRQSNLLGAAQASLREQVRVARDELRRKVAGADIRLATAVQRLAQLETVSQVARPLEVLRRASAPGAPVAPRPVRDTILGGVLGLVLGLLAAFARTALDRRVRSSAEIADALGLPLVGRVSDSALGGAGLLTPPGKVSPEDVEAMAVLRANLEFLGTEAPVRSVIVTSALAGEGKTTIACGLAAAAAAAGRRVLLIEADLRRPTVAERLGVDAGPGLGDYLAGRAAPQEILQTVALPGRPADADGAPGPVVVCITAGHHRDRPAELLHSVRCRELLEQVRDVYDLVVVDGTPLLSVADAIEVLPHVDGALVCVRAGRTRREQVRAARGALERVPARPSGIVVTGLSKRDEERYEYYSYAPSREPEAAGQA